MNRHWIDHVEDAQMQLDLAKAHSTPAKAADCLYEAMVHVTRAVMELEKDSQERGD